MRIMWLLQLHAVDRGSLVDCLVCCVGGCDVELLGNVKWTDLELLISSNTSPSLVDSVRRIREFIRQQKMNSRRALRDIAPGRHRTFPESRTAIPSGRPDERSAPTGLAAFCCLTRLVYCLCPFVKLMPYD